MNNHINGIWLSSIIGNISYEIYIKRVYNSLYDLKSEYYNFDEWYFNKVIPNITANKRDIFITLNNDNISGILIIKSDKEENKICTLRVNSNYKGNGIGKILLEKSFEKLQTEKPFITISQSRHHEFKKILTYYDFKLEYSAIHYYGLGSVEHCYNGVLDNNSLKTNKTKSIEKVCLYK
jgi:predicted GNAT family N-acyltransferase